MFKIFDTITTEVATMRYGSYVKDLNVCIKFYDDSLYVTDLTNALKRGKSCDQFVISMNDFDKNRSFISQFENWLDEWPLTEFIQRLFVDYTDFRGIRVTLRILDSIRVFSPFTKIKSIKTPEKWTLAHTWKAILAGQITKAEVNWKYTDDYERDADTNFGKGEIEPVVLAKKIIESPSGWWVKDEGKTDKEGILLSLNCHDFTSNKLYFKQKVC